MLPVAAALGGVLMPVLIFVVVIAGGEGASGWAIPAATDIAFAIESSRCSAIASRPA